MTVTMRKVALLAATLVLAAAIPVRAESRHDGRVVVVPRAFVYSPFFYDPFWDPYYAYGDPYAYPLSLRGEVRVQVTPKQTRVYVDGYYAGVADDFDGVFQRLHVRPGGHAITLYLDGYRTITENIYVRPDTTTKLSETMEKLPAGETSAPVPPPANPAVQPGPAGQARARHDGHAGW